jgi:hypothetical protein
MPPLFQDPETRSIEVGVTGTILFHLLLLLLIPQIMRHQKGHPIPRRPAPPRQFQIQLAPPPPRQPVPPPPKKFVEANPNANNNVPTNTTNFAAQNQTVAQEKPTPKGQNDMPAIEGQKEIKTTQIVNGTLEKQEAQAPVAPSSVTPPKAAITPPKQEQKPLAGTDKTQGKNPDGYGTALSKDSDNVKPIQQEVKGAKNVPVAQDAAGTTPRIDPRHPQPRKTLQQHVRPAIFTENKFGTQNIGAMAVDARWSSYGEYLQRLIESVQIEWDKILEASQAYPPSGTVVSVKFTLDAKGKIAAIIEVGGTSDEHGRAACVAAITNRAPYGEWPADMIALLGQSQDMTFTFYYQ